MRVFPRRLEVFWMGVSATMTPCSESVGSHVLQCNALLPLVSRKRRERELKWRLASISECPSWATARGSFGWSSRCGCLRKLNFRVAEEQPVPRCHHERACAEPQGRQGKMPAKLAEGAAR